MRSPFFWRHVGILLLVVVNLALSVVAAQKARSSFSGAALSLSVALRSGSVVYLTASLLIVLLATALFAELELSDHAQQCWKTNQDWAKVKVGMTRHEVIQLLGDPPSIDFADDYSLHPFDYFGGAIFYDKDDAAGQREADAKVTEKHPEGSVEWLPGRAVSACRNDLSGYAKAFCTFGLMILAVLSLIPLSLRAGANSSMLYLPLAALVLAVTYEWNQTAGWRFDLFLFYPIYALILGSWALRVWSVVRT